MKRNIAVTLESITIWLSELTLNPIMGRFEFLIDFLQNILWDIIEWLVLTKKQQQHCQTYFVITTNTGSEVVVYNNSKSIKPLLETLAAYSILDKETILSNYRLVQLCRID